jgi:GGDEF domain-containing protein
MRVTVNITCRDCDGRRLCEACRNAARAFETAGFRVEHSTRYAALRAAAAGTYGFDACVVPVESRERAVIDAALLLFAGKRLAFVVDGPGVPQSGLGTSVTLQRDRYNAGDFSLAWLTGAPASETSSVLTPVALAGVSYPETLAGGADQAQATRRLKRLADDARATVARAGLPAAPRLDLVAVLEDEVAWARASGNAFGVILVHLPGISASKPTGSPAIAEKRIADTETILARTVRSSDIVSGRGDDFLIALPEADEAGTANVLERVAAAIEASGLRAAVKQRRARGFAAWSIGTASFPTDGATRDVLLARATATLKPL